MRNKRSGRLVAVVVAMCMILGSGPAVLLAQAGTDIEGHWAEQIINRWVDRNIVDGYPDGTFQPNAPIRRAEFAALTNRTFGFITLSSVEFSDISGDEWFATDVSTAVGAGYMDGYPDGTFRPNDYISRQEAAMVLARILGLEETDETFGFIDIESIPAWSLWAVVAVANAGIMTGYPDGSFGPTDSFTRAETVTALDRLVAEVFTEEGTYGNADEQTVIEGNVIITAGGVTLVNMHITGNLLIAESVGDGAVTLQDVTVDGTVTVSGGEVIEEETTALALPGGPDDPPEEPATNPELFELRVNGMPVGAHDITITEAELNLIETLAFHLTEKAARAELLVTTTLENGIVVHEILADFANVQYFSADMSGMHEKHGHFPAGVYYFTVKLTNNKGTVTEKVIIVTAVAAPISVSEVSVVDGADGYTPVTLPLIGQVIRANIILSDGTVIGTYPVNENAVYKWYYRESPDTVLGTEGSYTVTSDNIGETVCVEVTVKGYDGSAIWEAEGVILPPKDVAAADFGVMTISGVIGYNVGFNLINATASDVDQVVVRLYKEDEVLAINTSTGILEKHADLTSLSAPFDVLGDFDYVQDGCWHYSGWEGKNADIPTKAGITVLFKNGVVQTATNENLTGDNSIFSKSVINTTKILGYDTIKEAVSDATEGDTILVQAGTYEENNINITKGITIKGSPDFATQIRTSGENPVFNLGAAATLDGLFILKTDKTNQHLVTMTANDARVVNSKFVGQYVQDDNEVARAIVPNAGITGYTISGNHFESLRQPGYLEGAGSVTDNFVKNTRGWVICVNHEISLSGNAFDGNAVDIAIIANNQLDSDYYTDIAAISAANNGAYVENQLLKVSARDGSLFVEAGENLNANSIENAVKAAKAGDTILISGSFGGFIVNKPLTIIGGVIAPATLLGEPAGIYVTTAGSGTVIDGVQITGTVEPRSVGIVTQVDTELTVTNSNLTNLTTGIYLNPRSKLTATGNTIANVVAGIGTERADLTGEVSGNVFTGFTSEAIGLYLPLGSFGGLMTEEEATALAAALETANGLNPGCVKLYGDFPEELQRVQDSGQNERNKDNGWPYIEYEIVGRDITIRFVNPTTYAFAFNYRVDGEEGRVTEWSSTVIQEGELTGQQIGPSYNIVNVKEGAVERTVTAYKEIWIGLRLGAEQNWFLDWIKFEFK